MTAPTLSRERAVEIGWARMPVEIRPDWYGINPPVPTWVLDALQDAYAEGAAQGEADRRDAEVAHYELQQARARVDRAVQILTSIHSYLAPPQVTMPDGRVFEWSNVASEHEMLAALSKLVREIPDNVAALAQTKQWPKYGGGGAVGVPVGAEIKWTEPPDAKP